VGQVGQAFVDALRAQVPNKSVEVYPVDYLASNQFGDRMEFARSVVDGIRDAGSHVQAISNNCPNTRIVLGGFSRKTITLCSPGDEICDGTPGGMPGLAHLMSGANGMVNQAVAFTADRL
jgi:hypothetical protein